MRIGISGFFLDNPATGSGQYVVMLLKELAAIAGEQIVVFYPRGTKPGSTERLPDSGSVAMVEIPMPLRGPWGKLWYEQVGLPQACRLHRVDLLHVPYLAPPLVKPCPTVVTIHDLIMLILPHYRGSPGVRMYNLLVSLAARRADLIIADSQYTRRDVVRRLGVPSERVRVIYLGCSPSFAPVKDACRLEAIRRKYGLPGDFVLYLGGLDRRKNVSALIKAFAALEGNLSLAIAGKAHSSTDTLYPNIARVVEEAGVKDRVVPLGFVPEEDKPALYSAARLFVFPSLYEGFGLTPLEAMACGTPVVCSRASSLPEVVGDAAITFDPGQVGELIQAMGRMLGSEQVRKEYQEKGLRQARSFPWRKTAEEALRAYRELQTQSAPAQGLWLDSSLNPGNITFRRALKEMEPGLRTVLEVGCGVGRFIRLLKLYLPHLKAFGCDVNPSAVRRARGFDGQVRYALGNLNSLPYPGETFDAVLLFDVLEHVEDPQGALDEIRRVLRPGGLLHALVPCEGEPLTLHWALARLNILADLKERQAGHIQRFSHTDLLRRLAQGGFVVKRVTYSMHPLGQAKDILAYLEREEWFRRRGFDNLAYRILVKILWGASYAESRLLFWLPFSAVALHITAKKGTVESH